MLDRETCEALAAAVPEVREHARFLPGDRYYTPGGNRLEVISVAVRAWTMEGRPVLWCPSLADLLSMAQKRAGESGQIDLRSHPTWWECGLIVGVDGVFVQAGDTPDQAVAAWLIEHAERGAAQ